MHDMLNINEDKPTAQQTGTTSMIFKKKPGKRYIQLYVPNENNKVLHSPLVSDLY